METASSSSESSPSPSPAGSERGGRPQGGSSLEAVATRLHTAAIHLLRRLRAEDLEAGITPARLSALSVLVFGGPCSVSELAAAEQVSVPTMSRLVSSLEERGLVTRRPDPSDGRAVRLEPSPEGRRMLEEGRDRRVGRLAEMLSRLGAEDLAAVERTAAVLEALLAPSDAGEEDG